MVPHQHPTNHSAKMVPHCCPTTHKSPNQTLPLTATNPISFLSPQTDSHTDPFTDAPEASPATHHTPHPPHPQPTSQTDSHTDSLTDVPEASPATHPTPCPLPMTELYPMHQPTPSTARRTRKFLRYNHNTRHTKTLHPCMNTHHVVNLSSHRLSKYELSVLNKGLTFVPTPPIPNPLSLQKDVDTFARTLRLGIMFNNTNRNPMPFRPKSNYVPHKYQQQD